MFSVVTPIFPFCIFLCFMLFFILCNSKYKYCAKISKEKAHLVYSL
ncbi:hypothetical protein HMPREF9018_0028 [Prevotella amnii CRIS 21A-A]|uniref:Uncharacterized protein n=1 Tax=Prevotella amnii CRIS 21A-A TaxID=679191 RepID=E1GY74_9BACT|nr:hypothetical protein HMPREF9018_0028 [Prevotella amnii CRIS 21A-A]